MARRSLGYYLGRLGVELLEEKVDKNIYNKLQERLVEENRIPSWHHAMVSYVVVMKTLPSRI